MVGKSRTAVVKQLEHLVAAGRIEIPLGRHRGIRVVK
jgi:biotin operon repressor